MNYHLPQESLIDFDLLLIPYDSTDEKHYTAFMVGTYRLSKSFKLDYPELNV